MPLPALVKEHAEATLTAYCENRIPPHVRDKLRVGFKVRGAIVTLYEERPYYLDPSKWIRIVVAQFRYIEANRTWKLYCADRNSKWHSYQGLAPQKDLGAVLGEVDRDPTGIFWG